MIGDIVMVDGEEFEVIWAGGEGLVPDRSTKITCFWTPPKRLYNKKSDYWLTSHKRLDKGGPPAEDEQNGEEMVLRHGDPNEDLPGERGSEE